MIELHLIGYTADGERLVLDLDPDGEGRYAVPIDPDLLATIEQLRDVRVHEGLPVDPRPEARPSDPATPPEPEPGPEPAAGDPPAASVDLPPAPAEPPPAPAEPPPVPRWSQPPQVNGDRPAGGPRPVPAPRRVSSSRPSGRPTARAGRTTSSGRSGALDDTGEIEPIVVPDGPSQTPDGRHEHRPSSSAVPHAQLSPAEIQAQLRSGRSVRAVATEAGTDRAWIERWLPPIVAERERMLAEARRRRLDVPRARALGGAVDRSLSERGVTPEEATWSASRRADGRWRISVRFDDRGRARTATWVMDPAEDRLQAASPLAEELAGPGRRPAQRRR